MDWCQLDIKKSKLWAQQLLKFKSHLGPNKNTPTGKSLLRNVDQLTLCGGLLYHRYTPKYQVDEVKHFIVLRAHRRTAIDGCHRDVGTRARREWRTLSLINSHGQVSMKMSTEQSRIADDVNSMERRRKRFHGPSDGHCPPPVGTSQL